MPLVAIGTGLPRIHVTDVGLSATIPSGKQGVVAGKMEERVRRVAGHVLLFGGTLGAGEGERRNRVGQGGGRYAIVGACPRA